MGPRNGIAWPGGTAEQGAPRRRRLGAERHVGDDAAGLPGAGAQGRRSEAAAGDPALGYLDVESDVKSGQHALRLGLVLDLLCEQPNQMDRALAVPDQNEGPAIVAMLQIMPPGGQHVAIGQIRDRRGVLAPEECADACKASATWSTTMSGRGSSGS